MKKQKQEKPKENPEVEMLKNQLARTLADYDNLVKRSDQEKVSWIKFANQGLVQNLLPVLDAFEAAQNHLKDSGLVIAINQLKQILKQEGLEEIIPKLNDNFDENLHEAIEVVSGKEDGKIAEILTSGWKFMDGNVIRHARVKVYKSEAEKAS